MRLVSWNVNGIRSCAGKGLQPMLQQLKPDVLCLQETKADAACVSSIAQSLGFSEAHCATAQKKGYSGVASLFAPTTILAEGQRRALFLSPCAEIIDQEGRFVITDCLVPTCGEFRLYNMYIPSGTSGDERQAFKMAFLGRLYDFLAGLSASERARCILCGDFNICHREIDIHHPREATQRRLTGFLPEERAWLDALQALGFSDAFRQCFPEGHPQASARYSWWSYRAGSRGKNLGWRIDYFWLGEYAARQLRAAQLHEDLLGSDHCPLSIDLG